MSDVLHYAGHHGDQQAYFFHCPGCECGHAFYTPRWTWNGSMDKPTVSPSILCNKDEPSRRCHSFVKEGYIQFLNDCHHKLAGQTVKLPEWEGWEKSA